MAGGAPATSGVGAISGSRMPLLSSLEKVQKRASQGETLEGRALSKELQVQAGSCLGAGRGRGAGLASAFEASRCLAGRLAPSTRGRSFDSS